MISSVTPRAYPAASAIALVNEGVHPLLARALAARGITSIDDVSGSLGRLIHHSQLKGAHEAAVYLADAIAAGRLLRIVADYDCDGATACATAVAGLRAMGAQVDYLVPDRMVHGYGLTPSVVDLAAERGVKPDILITVDNGIASHAGVSRAVELGMEVVVTDHHLPVKDKPLPAAAVIVDPSQPGCSFPSKALAGCGVVWYVLWALQDLLRERGQISPAMKAGFKISSLLPYVAIGTVADVVALDANNRILVLAGLKRIHDCARDGTLFPGISALCQAGKTVRFEPHELSTTDIAFGLGPRINAAGRLETMQIGIDCLLAADPLSATALAAQLDAINQERRDIEHAIAKEAVAQAMEQAGKQAGRHGIVVHRSDWHAGVIGIVASRIKERCWRPTFVLATDAASGQVKGSGRSIPGFNLKDALDMVDKENPGLMVKFGGHAMAAGLTLRPDGEGCFADAFNDVAGRLLTAEALCQELTADGSLPSEEITPATAQLLRWPPWGQGFPEPAFCDTFEVRAARITGERRDQLTMTLVRDDISFSAVRYRHAGPVPEQGVFLTAIYKLAYARNKFGEPTVRLLIDAIVAA